MRIKSFYINDKEFSFDEKSQIKNIKNLFQLAGSAWALSCKLGVSHQAVYQWEKRGWVPIDRASQIQKIFGIPMKYLIKPSLVKLLLEQVML